MFNRLFDKKNITAMNAWRAYNVLTAGAVLIGYLTNPEALAAEYITDVAVHLLQATISENSSHFAIGLSLGANAGRILDIFVRAGHSTVPYALNVIDISLNHCGSLIASSSALFSKKEENSDSYEDPIVLKKKM